MRQKCKIIYHINHCKDTLYTCSNCGHELETDKLDYCPYCDSEVVIEMPDDEFFKILDNL